MRVLYVFILVVTLQSCEYFKVKKTSPEAILNEELKTFNWNEVDEYPSFSVCDSLTNSTDKQACFSQTLTRYILQHLETKNITVNHNIADTITLQFEVSETGQLTLIDTKTDSLTIAEIPEINQLLHNSLDSLPKIFPAIKRGQQVKTRFTLPIIIQAR
ncbi:MAG: hypothetical protein ACK5NB_13155 [Flavobacteriaceae bacterium]